MNCPNHPTRPVVDAGVCTKQVCEECLANRMHAYSDYKGKREAWRDGSDYTRSAGATFYDSTRGRIQLTDYEPHGGKWK